MLFLEKAQSPSQLRGQAQVCEYWYETNVPEGGMDLLGIWISYLINEQLVKFYSFRSEPQLGATIFMRHTPYNCP